MGKFYITTTLPYVNAAPHLGFALEIIQADIIARFQKILGHEVVFNTGTDEHGINIYRTALSENKDPQQYVNEYAAKFDNLKQALNLSYTNFIRTTDLHHIKATHVFWEKCKENGDIYKQLYKIKYCPGCELEKTESELVDGKCLLHPTKEIEIIEEENYFFKWSKYQEPLLKLYENNPEFVLPDFRFNEIKQFVKGGLNDFSISRLKEKMPWGIPIPDDEDHVMYVWFDALINYIATLGWPDNKENFNNFWPGVQIAGKDNLRQQSAMWQAMLISANMPPSKQILIHGFITSNGQKMSKSLGNVVDPYEVVKKYGTDGLRYWVAREASTFEDSDFTWEKLNESYNANLANGLGNLVARVAKLCEKNHIEVRSNNIEFDPKIKDYLDEYQFNSAMDEIWSIIAEADKKINEERPWELEGEKAREVLEDLAKRIQEIAFNLQPFLPETAEKILNQFNGKIKSSAPLFPRIA
jgi:methionyl-tRNA synthetase